MIDDILTNNLAQLAEMAHAIKLGKNSVIIKEGAKDSLSMYIILQGEVRVVKNYGQFDQQVMARLSVGDFFGEMSLFLGNPRAATVITSADTVLLEINESNVYEIIETNPKLLFGMFKGLCKRIDFLNDKVQPQYRRN